MIKFYLIKLRKGIGKNERNSFKGKWYDVWRM